MEHERRSFLLSPEDYKQQVSEIEARIKELEGELDADLKKKAGERLHRLLRRIHTWDSWYKSMFYAVMADRTQSQPPPSVILKQIWDQYQLESLTLRYQRESRQSTNISIYGGSENTQQSPSPAYAPSFQGYPSPGGLGQAVPAHAAHPQGLPMRMLSQSARAPAAQGEYQPSAGRGGLARLAPTPLENSPSNSLRSQTSSNLFDLQDME
ncbi:unnamed protein product [Mycena citricolor]|uniref:Uncharacterized protein n=1 Tax=Mycena citricolor TaxID=2018698 RepID=A0AAD2HNB5_9AGAR|nr:unnamed protein product [Mycena citricolor]